MKLWALKKNINRVIQQQYQHKSMLGNREGKFETLVTKLLSGKQYERALQQGLKLYHIKQYHVEELTPNKIVQMYYLITTKFYYNRTPTPNESWYQNQLRVFIWLVVGYAYLENKNLAHFNQNDWNYFSQIFNFRNTDMFEFQTRTVLKRRNKSIKWERSEVNLLDSLIKSKSIKNKWNQIAKELFMLSGKKYFRTAKQCRQHWINHLNTNVVRSSWTAIEDLQLVETILKHGRKWSKVSKMLGGTRTQHMVKNRFKSLFHFQSKKFQARNYQTKELEHQIMMSLVVKLKSNIEQGHKLCQKRQSFAQMLKVETNEYAIYEDQSNQLLNEKNIYEEELNKCFQEIEKEESPKINEFLQEDCINIFFHESCMLQR